MMQHPFGSSNSTFVVTNDGVLVFDADIRTANQTMEAIRKTTDKKVRYVVISHPSGDHATGAWHFREDKPIVIGSRKCATSTSRSVPSSSNGALPRCRSMPATRARS
jgi:glyoxylase-like metal-dependent hydrolase (beta-lactamase superfamily II)